MLCKLQVCPEKEMSSQLEWSPRQNFLVQDTVEAENAQQGNVGSLPWDSFSQCHRSLGLKQYLDV